jgi:intron-binding protein aquarius
MTCTHAAIIRSRLLELNFKYDSLIVEESAQILDVETMIPMLLQHHDNVSGCRLKRIVLIGDHHQLPPIIQNHALQKYSHFDQSLFTRFIRLGVPSIILDKQGRARPEISELYSWRYKQLNGKSLTDLESAVVDNEVYQRANAGFLHTRQLIDVPDFKGKGEYAPTPYYYQNLGEAEYIVAVYQYMRLMGYPAEKISIITTYNGQKQLIEDIVSQRCKQSIFGPPASISTVDRFQGQQNDYILLSLVRSEAVGHVRDLRRLVVALSRARLGLYIFCRKELFENCFDLSNVFELLSTTPSKLQLVVGENHPTIRGKDDEVTDKAKIFEVEDVTMMGVLVYQLSQHATAQQSIANA